MDILDIMLARAMTPQGKTEAYVAKAEKAAQDAVAAQASATAAIQTVESAADEIATAREEAASLLTEAQEALETAQSAQINTIDIEDVQDEIKNLDVSANMVEGTNANTIQVITTYPDDTLHTENLTKLYKGTGSNEDGTMTQKAITDALGNKVDSVDLNSYASKTYVDNAVAAIPAGGGGISNLGTANAGKMVVVGEDGNITAGRTKESEILEALIRTGIYAADGALGLDINYQDKILTRTQDAASLTMGEDFDEYLMYGGRVRCNVADDGTINAFYGESGYADDGSNGQVMIYQPKFYYQRNITNSTKLAKGSAIYQEEIILSSKPAYGFKLHPLFDAGDGEEYDYVLLSAYEGTINNNKLCSISGAQPISNITIAQAETAAKARGTGWHIMNMKAISANQMLEIVEFGSMNGQESLEAGISNLAFTANINCSAIIGSTAALGNTTGHATSTVSNNNGTLITNTEAGKRAISYRGMENPWGNMWQMIGGINILGDGKSQGGAPYICTNYNYTPSIIGNNYEYIGFNLPSQYGWISAMGYGSEDYDWIFLPVECASTANSLLPVGDNLWTVANLSANKIVALGGTYGFKDSNGPFYYACDTAASTSTHNYNARLMYIPTKGATYTNNITKWTTYIGG